MTARNKVIISVLIQSMPVLKLTKSKVDEIPFTVRGQTLYHDTELKGFGLVVGRQTKTYFAQHAIDNRTVRYSIGRHGVFTTEEARRDARLLLADMCRGIDPNKIKKEKKLKDVTLEVSLENYLRIKKDLSERSKFDYRYSLDKYLYDWKNKPLGQITKEMVVKHNAHIRECHGGAVATKAMRVLSAIYNNAKLWNDKLPENPVMVLSRAKLWYRSERRQTVIKPHQLRPWFEAVNALENIMVRDYLVLLLFTGMRKSEGLKLKWDNIDFDEKTFTLEETKNGRSHKLPMSDVTQNLLLERLNNRKCKTFVFPGLGESGHLEAPKKGIKKVIEASGVKFALHDLRRTYITVAESLDISNYALKYMINHKTGGDLTGGYIILDVNRIREPVQRVSDKLWSLINTNNTDLALNCLKLPTHEVLALTASSN